MRITLPQALQLAGLVAVLVGLALALTEALALIIGGALVAIVGIGLEASNRPARAPRRKAGDQ